MVAASPGVPGAVFEHHPPAGQPADEGAGELPRGEDSVGERLDGGGVDQQRPDVDELGAAGLGVGAGADGVLHEEVRHDDEVGGEVDRHRDGPDGGA